MAWETRRLQPQSDEAAQFFENYSSAVEQMVEYWNAFREEKYLNHEDIFGYTTADLPQETFPEILTDSFLQIRMDNEYQWKTAFIDIIESGTLPEDIAEVIPPYREVAEFPDEVLLHDELFYDLGKYRLTIETTLGNCYEYKLSKPIQDPSKVTNMSPPVIEYSDGVPELELYIEEDYTTTSYVEPEGMLEEDPREDSFFESVYPIVNMLGVYSGALDAGVFEVNKRNIEDANELFEILGFYVTEMETEHYTTNLFFITYDPARKDTFDEFCSEHPNVSMEEVYEVLGYPTDGAKQISTFRKDAIAPINFEPGLEYVIYGMDTGEISPRLASFWPYVYYRPAFTITSVKQSLKDARKLANALKANKSRFKKINGDEVAPLVEEFIETKGVHIEWPDTPSMLRPHSL